MKTQRKYRSLRTLFASAKRWTQGAYARNAKGRVCSSKGSAATQFCLIGGMQHVYGNSERYGEVRNALEKVILKKYRDSSIVVFNDNVERTFKDIQAVIRAARV